ncbi:prepilin-type N-terminal cleavage/methylation domain-containing protein [Candidatus Sumerlaeota bacterium]|nr:prepilin-type N-terminal cleavage/methylation domain-containing protein [Candidatus Sumerlaeales bacterium]NLD61532.1 prepilin-type N-terminal cleavage/methylation domain-containing protein [Candidatus Sumerlaeota bacterium]
MKNKLCGFTLIELLIVVAIIAILAAIAVPNFLEAQTRAKISRVQTDLRTIKTALESYFVDHNHYPDCMTWAMNGANAMTRMEELTSPIAYINSVPIDPFNLTGYAGQIGPWEYVYYTAETFTNRTLFEQIMSAYNDSSPSSRLYLLFGVGPDNDADYCTGPYQPRGIITYDATNGTKSNGDIATYGP